MYVVGRSAKWLLVEVVGARVVAFNMDEASASSPKESEEQIGSLQFCTVSLLLNTS